MSSRVKHTREKELSTSWRDLSLGSALSKMSCWVSSKPIPGVGVKWKDEVACSLKGLQVSCRTAGYVIQDGRLLKCLFLKNRVKVLP